MEVFNNLVLQNHEDFARPRTLGENQVGRLSQRNIPDQVEYTEGKNKKV